MNSSSSTAQLASSASMVTSSASEHVELESEETDELGKLFKLVDKDGGGTIDMDEFMELLASMSAKPTPSQMSLLFQEIDLNHNSTIEFEEFFTFMTTSIIRSSHRVKLTKAFEVLAGIASPATPDHISRQDLITAFQTYAPDLLSSASAHAKTAKGGGGGAAARAGANSANASNSGNNNNTNNTANSHLAALFKTLPTDRHGYFNYVQFAERNTLAPAPDDPQNHAVPMLPPASYRRVSSRASSDRDRSLHSSAGAAGSSIHS